MADFAIWREAGYHYSMRIRAVEESSTCEGDITTMILEGPIYRGGEVVQSQHVHAELMLLTNADAEITYSLTLFYPSNHAFKMTQIDLTNVFLLFNCPCSHFTPSTSYQT